MPVGISNVSIRISQCRHKALLLIVPLVSICRWQGRDSRIASYSPTGACAIVLKYRTCHWHGLFEAALGKSGAHIVGELTSGDAVVFYRVDAANLRTENEA